MSQTNLPELLGIRPGQSTQWERPMLFLGALFAGDLVWSLLGPSVSHSSATGFSFEFFRFSGAITWISSLLSAAFVVVIAVAALRLIPNLPLAIGALAVAYGLIFPPLSNFLQRIAFRGSLNIVGEAFPLFDLWRSVWYAVWALCFFGAIALALRQIQSRWLAILVGAVGGTILQRVAHVLTSRFTRGDELALGFGLRMLPFTILESVLMAFTLAALLKLSPDPVLGAPPPRMSRGFYVGTLTVAYGLPALVSVAVIAFLTVKAWDPSDAPLSLFLLGLVSLFLMYGAVVFCFFLYRIWAAIQDGHARTTPGRAVGFLFIPFFNLYWGFQALAGFANDYNSFTSRHSLNLPRLSPGIFTAYMILIIATLIPVLGYFVVPVSYVLGLIMVSRASDAVNALPSTLSFTSSGQPAVTG